MSDSTAYAVASGILIVYYIAALAATVLVLVALWKIFVKAGKPGWGAIVPFYNTYCLFEMSFGNGWLFLLLLVPCVDAVIGIIMLFKLAKAFGKGGGFAVGLIFLPVVFIPMLGFGDAVYYGPVQGQQKTI